MKKIQILGGGCPKCAKLYELAKTAAEAASLDYEIEKVTDMNRYADFGVMFTPALVVDGEVKVSGRVPTAEQVADMLK